MRDPVSQGIELLAQGLRPFVASQALSAGVALPPSWKHEPPDCQALLLFIWDRWNDAFRPVLSYVERSLVSELREFRNRWAHQQPFTEHDTYRFLEDAERLLKAVRSPLTGSLTELRKSSLKRLYELEIAVAPKKSGIIRFWPLGLCLGCALALDYALLYRFQNSITVIMAILIILLMARLGYLLTIRESLPSAGPRECTDCGRIVYTAICPYCEASSLRHLAMSVLIRPENLAENSADAKQHEASHSDCHANL